MDVILPVAGLGSRLRPQTWSRPKPLLGLAGKPILEHVLDEVMPLRPEKLVFITGYLGDQVEAWARATYDMELAFVEQPEMLGQTDAILRVRPHAKNDGLILFPDMVFAAEFERIATSDADVVIFTKDVEDPSAFGIAVEEGAASSNWSKNPRTRSRTRRSSASTTFAACLTSTPRSKSRWSEGSCSRTSTSWQTLSRSWSTGAPRSSQPQ